MQQLDTIMKLIGAVVVIVGIGAVLWVYFRRGMQAEWEQVAKVRQEAREDCERKVTALTLELTQLRGERDGFERQLDRRLAEILQLHARIDELERERARHRRPKDSDE